MASFEFNNSNGTEQNGIKIEVWEPNFIVLPISESREGINTCLKINVAINNERLRFYPFIYDILIPELLAPNGQQLHPQKIANSQKAANLYNGMGIPFKKTLICYLIAKLSWHNNLLQLQTAISYFSQASNEINYLWSFDDMQLGIYQIRFVYSNTNRTYAKTTELRHYERSEVISQNAGIASLHFVPVAMTIYSCVSPD